MYPVKINPDEAQSLLLNQIPQQKTEKIPLWAAPRRVLSEDVVTNLPLPPFDRSAFDGFAFRSADTASATREQPVCLSVLEDVLAGHTPASSLQPGTAVRIMTGAPIPAGADAIRKFEWTEYNENSVRLFSPARAGENVIRAGEDMAVGTLLANAGTLIGHSLPGMLASQGRAYVPVFRRPVAAIINTGTEIVMPNQPRPASSIYNSSLYNIAAWLSNEGLLPMNGGLVTDNPNEILQRLDEVSSGSDVILTTGGVSVGDADFMPEVLERWGARILFWKLAMKPGGAMIAAVKDGKLILGLSGNPGAAILQLMRIAQPALRRLCGRKDYLPSPVFVRLREPLTKESTRLRLLRGRLVIGAGEAWLTRLDKQGPGDLSSLLDCDLLGEIPAGSGPVEAGTLIRAYRY